MFLSDIKTRPGYDFPLYFPHEFSMTFISMFISPVQQELLFDFIFLSIHVNKKDSNHSINALSSRFYCKRLLAKEAANPRRVVDS